MKAVSNSILGSALLAGCLVLASAPGSTASAQLKEVRMMEAGGASGESIEAGYLKPFTEKPGIKVVRESPWSLGKIRGLVETGVITPAIAELASRAMEQAQAPHLPATLDGQATNPDAP